MSKSCLCSLFAVSGIALGLTACQAPGQFLDAVQPAAIQTALSRGQYEMNCPAATATVLNRLVEQPALGGPWGGGAPRGVFTIGVSGCGQRGVFSAICPQGGDGCFGVGNPNIQRE
jgi:hypothetical protein